MTPPLIQREREREKQRERTRESKREQESKRARARERVSEREREKKGEREGGTERERVRERASETESERERERELFKSSCNSSLLKLNRSLLTLIGHICSKRERESYSSHHGIRGIVYSRGLALAKTRSLWFYLYHYL